MGVHNNKFIKLYNTFPKANHIKYICWNKRSVLNQGNIWYIFYWNYEASAPGSQQNSTFLFWCVAPKNILEKLTNMKHIESTTSSISKQTLKLFVNRYKIIISVWITC